MRSFEVKTSRKQEMVNITSQVQGLIEDSNFDDGVLVLYVPHTTAGITINESADPIVEADILKDLQRLVPASQPTYEHFEGNSDAHTLTSIIGSSVTLLVEDRRIILGRWQGIFLCEFDGPRRRTIVLHS